MNKSELVSLLRKPGNLSQSQLKELEDVVEENPYFLSARLLLAKGSRELKDPKFKKRIASAAIYSTDRILFKKYLSGDLFFLKKPEVKQKTERKKVVTARDLSEKQEKSKPPERRDKRPSALIEKPKKAIPEVPVVPAGDLDAILEELQQDMQNLKSSREHFKEVQQQIIDAENIESIKSTVQTEVEESSKQNIEAESNPQPEEFTDTLAPKEEKPQQAVEVAKNEVAENEKEESPAKTESSPEPPAKEIVKEEISEEEEAAVAKKLAELAEQTKTKKTPVARKKPVKRAVKSKKDTKPKEPKKEEPVARKASKTPIKKTEKEAPSSSAAIEGERAQDPFRETRFDKSATRSYLKKLEAPEDFLPFEEEQSDDKPASEALSASTKEQLSAEENSKDQKSGDIEESAVPKDETPEKSEPIDSTAHQISKEETQEPTESKVEAKPTKTEPKAKEPTSSSKNSIPKGSIMKKAKLVKSKRSSRRNAAKPSPDEAKEDDGKSEPAPVAPPKTKADQSAIIDKFIKDSPSIKHTRTQEASPSDLAQSSGAWNKELASEHLAEIFLKQGNKQRALEIYEVLSLKYPEKKSYFADLISKVQ
ncbi:MAG: hypothetical protein AAF616_01455 [Bacteroidota bacterium]